MKEEIVPIPGYEEHYGATRDGRIYSFNYWGRGYVKELSQTILTDKRRDSKTKYKRVKVSKINKNNPVAVHRIIAMTFVPNPNNYKCVNHIDGDKGNNHADNLEWCTNRQNIIHAEKNGLSNHVKGEDHGLRILTEKEVLEIRKELSESEYRGQLKVIGDKYGVSLHCIFDIKHRRSWKHL